jgi:hypothetical protein
VSARAKPYWVRPAPVLLSGAMRLRPLSEAECYARCYGGHSGERVTVVRRLASRTQRPGPSGERLRELFEEKLDARDHLEVEAA